jgi:hypothetical protein
MAFQAVTGTDIQPADAQVHRSGHRRQAGAGVMASFCQEKNARGSKSPFANGKRGCGARAPPDEGIIADEKTEFLEFSCLHRPHPGSLW